MTKPKNNTMSIEEALLKYLNDIDHELVGVAKDISKMCSKQDHLINTKLRLDTILKNGEVIYGHTKKEILSN